jgi:hypothetical protein
MNESEINLDNLPLAEALSFADEGSTTGGLLTHAALKTLAAGCRELTAARAKIEAVTEQRDRLAEALWSMLNQDDGSAIRAGILLRSLGLQSPTNPNEP